MDFRRLGDSGLKVSEVGLGCNNFGMRIEQAETDAVVGAALEAGINFFDTADIYGGTRSCWPPNSPCRSAPATSSAADRGAM